MNRSREREGVEYLPTKPPDKRSINRRRNDRTGKRRTIIKIMSIGWNTRILQLFLSREGERQRLNNVITWSCGSKVIRNIRPKKKKEEEFFLICNNRIGIIKGVLLL